MDALFLEIALLFANVYELFSDSVELIVKAGFQDVKLGQFLPQVCCAVLGDGLADDSCF